jgi:hypothetical protein
VPAFAEQAAEEADMDEHRERDRTAPAQREDGQRRPRRKTEEEMSKGKDYTLHRQDAQFVFDPLQHKAAEEGGEP